MSTSSPRIGEEEEEKEEEEDVIFGKNLIHERNVRLYFVNIKKKHKKS